MKLANHRLRNIMSGPNLAETEQLIALFAIMSRALFPEFARNISVLSEYSDIVE
jgi:hypothetical protein